MRPPATIVTITANPSLDVHTSVDAVEPTRKLRCEAPRFQPGGGGLNVARVVASLGGDALALWARGGATGDLLQELLDAERLPHRPLAVSGRVRESLTVLARQSNDQYRFVLPGPMLAPDALDGFIEEVTDVQPRPALVIASGSLPPGIDTGFYGRLARRVADRGVRFVLDTTGPALEQALATGAVSLIKPNLREFAALVGRPLEDDAAIADAAIGLVRAGASAMVVVSLGADGLIAADRDRSWRIRVPPVAVRSAVGAGDSTVAGLGLALSRHDSLEDAARLGAAAGAAAVMTPGSDLCRPEDVTALLPRITS